MAPIVGATTTAAALMEDTLMLDRGCVSGFYFSTENYIAPFVTAQAAHFDVIPTPNPNPNRTPKPAPKPTPKPTPDCI